MAARRKNKISDALQALPDDPYADGAEAAFRKALLQDAALVVARVANLIAKDRVDGYWDELCTAYDRLEDKGAKRDPGCLAKTAVLEALDYTDYSSEDVFLRAVAYQQPEAVMGGSEDTATGVRTRAILALSRLGCADLLLHAGPLLGDAAPSVRSAAATAIGHHRQREGAGLLGLKLKTGDEDPLVLSECMTALLLVAPDYAITVLANFLNGKNDTLRELASLALAQSHRPAALEVLIAFCDEQVIAQDRVEALTAIGFHRSDRALKYLLALINDGNDHDAEAALRSLAPRRFEPAVASAIEDALADHEHGESLRVIQETEWT